MFLQQTDRGRRQSRRRAWLGTGSTINEPASVGHESCWVIFNASIRNCLKPEIAAFSWLLFSSWCSWMKTCDSLNTQISASQRKSLCVSCCVGSLRSNYKSSTHGKKRAVIWSSIHHLRVLDCCLYECQIWRRHFNSIELIFLACHTLTDPSLKTHRWSGSGSKGWLQRHSRSCPVCQDTMKWL